MLREQVIEEVLLGRRLRCFVSFPQGHKDVEAIIYSDVIPALQDLGIDPLHAGQTASAGINIADAIVRGIKSADLFLCDLTVRDPNVTYELGLAHAWGKPTLSITQKPENMPLDLFSTYPVIVYGQLSELAVRLPEELKSRIIRILERPKSLQTPTLLRYVNVPKTVGIEIFAENIDAILALKFIQEFLEYFRREGEATSLQVRELTTGSIGAWISTSIESITRLVEKIIFLVPEWKTKLARKERILAEVEKTRAEAESIRSETKRNEVKSFLENIEKAQQLGVTRVTLGDRLKIETKPDGSFEIGPPEKAMEREF